MSLWWQSAQYDSLHCCCSDSSNWLSRDDFFKTIVIRFCEAILERGLIEPLCFLCCCCWRRCGEVVVLAAIAIGEQNRSVFSGFLKCFFDASLWPCTPLTTTVADAEAEFGCCHICADCLRAITLEKFQGDYDNLPSIFRFSMRWSRQDQQSHRCFDDDWSGYLMLLVLEHWTLIETFGHGVHLLLMMAVVVAVAVHLRQRQPISYCGTA